MVEPPDSQFSTTALTASPSGSRCTTASKADAQDHAALVAGRSHAGPSRVGCHTRGAVPSVRPQVTVAPSDALNDPAPKAQRTLLIASGERPIELSRRRIRNGPWGGGGGGGAA